MELNKSGKNMDKRINTWEKKFSICEDENENSI